MADFVLTNAFISIDSNDLSDHVTSVSVSYEADAIENTAFGDDTHVHLGGLKNWSMEVQFNQDFAASQVDAIMFPLVGAVVTVIVRPDSGSVSATNPNFTGSGLIQSYPPLGNGVGELAGAQASIVAAGSLSRATS